MCASCVKLHTRSYVGSHDHGFRAHGITKIHDDGILVKRWQSNDNKSNNNENNVCILLKR